MNRARLRELGFELGARAEGGVSDDGAWFATAPGGDAGWPNLSPKGRTLLRVLGPNLVGYLDYPGSGPEHAQLRDSGRVRYESVTDSDAVDAFRLLSRLEGIIPALESAHAFAQAFKEAGDLAKDEAVVITMSGRGDKDIFTIAHAFGDPSWKRFIREKGEAYAAE